MRFSFIVSTALAIGLMLSPESLTLFGNNIGLTSISFLVIILFVAIVQIFTALSYGKLFALFPGQGSETRFIKFVSVKYVPLSKLAETTIPHMITARKILGQNGRIIMGIVILAGACSAVNALFIAVPRMITGMAQQGLIPRSLGVINKQPVPIIPTIVLTIGISIMMATGMAGEPTLEVYIRAGLLFWLLNYVVMHLCVLILRRRLPYHTQHIQVIDYPVVTVIGLLAIFIGFIVSLVSYKESIHLLTFMFVIYIMITFFSLVWIGLHRKKDGPFSDGLKQ